MENSTCYVHIHKIWNPVGHESKSLRQMRRGDHPARADNWRQLAATGRQLAATGRQLAGRQLAGGGAKEIKRHIKGSQNKSIEK